MVPLWVFYEWLAFKLNAGWQGDYRTGIDLLIKKSLHFIGLSGSLTVIVPSVILIIWVAIELKELKQLNFKIDYCAWMFMESIFYALLLGLILGLISNKFLTLQKSYSIQIFLQNFVKHLGSGIFEELIFRLLLISILMKVLSPFFSKKIWIPYGMAAILSAIVFSFMHHLSLFGESFTWHAFLFRFMAGVIFAVLFIFRGYGITAYSHSFYNIFLMFR